MSRTLALLVNPTAGSGRGARHGRLATQALQAAGHQVIDVTGTDATDSRRRARAAIADRVDGLVVCGGDGTVHLGANLVADTGIPLGVIAAGSGNDIAATLGLPIHDPTAAVRVITAGTTRLIDAGRVDWQGGQRWFAGVLGAGFDARVSLRAMSLPRLVRGPIRYVAAVLRELPVFTPIPYAVTVDERTIRTEAMLVAVANAPRFGGGIRVCPDAEPDDGLFDVLICHRLGKAEFLRVFPTVFSGRHLGHPAIEVIRGRQVRLEAPGLVAQADGEQVAALPLDITLVPDALRVFAGPSGLPAGTAPGGAPGRAA